MDPKKRGALGQYFTSDRVSMFMASLFTDVTGEIHLLDPGCGSGSLTAAFADRVLTEAKATKFSAIGYDVEGAVTPFIEDTYKHIIRELEQRGIDSKTEFRRDDYLLETSFFSHPEEFSHCILNPPYKKISSSSEHRKALRQFNIETVNLYSGFLAKAILQTKSGGEIVAIIPRSFCNGPYYQSFRELILKETAIIQIHIFESRTDAFSDDKVLQENVILHLKRHHEQGEVIISSSPNSDFELDESSGTVTATDFTQRRVPFDSIVKPSDRQKFFHIAADPRDQKIIDALSRFTCTLEDLELNVSTGPVVDFRLKDQLRPYTELNAVPLLYPKNIRTGIVDFPVKDKKADRIAIDEKSRPWLWKNSAYFVLVRRFSSKEEKRRIVAALYDGSLDGDFIGFENKLNVFHFNKSGIDGLVAKGLVIYLNSSLLDKYYRIFGGHTQVNASDLKAIHYPSRDFLSELGQSWTQDITSSQESIDSALRHQIQKDSGMGTDDPLDMQKKIDRTIELLNELGLPKAQQNERSALTLLALLNLKPSMEWVDIEMPMLGVTPIMDWLKSEYGKEYAPNTRETIRRQTLHQFVDGGLALYNPDEPSRPVNSPKACYQIAPELFELLKFINDDDWDEKLATWLSERETLIDQYAQAREMELIPLTLDDGTEIKLSPGEHSKLIHDIVSEFGPRFAPGAEVIYLGDTGAKEDFFRKERLKELGVTVDRKGKLPDVVLYWAEKNWLLLIESVTSHGPVDGKRHNELKTLFSNAKPGLVYVTAFPSRRLMTKYLAEISWETEVWVAEAPTHMIHFNGDRFLGPHD